MKSGLMRRGRGLGGRCPALVDGTGAVCDEVEANWGAVGASRDEGQVRSDAVGARWDKDHAECDEVEANRDVVVASWDEVGAGWDEDRGTRSGHRARAASRQEAFRA